jgi:hypothetical protein
MTKKPEKANFLILLAAVWLALAVIWAGVFVIAEHNHEHINSAGHRIPDGKNCRICLEIQIVLRFMETLGRLGVGMALTGFIVYAFSLVKPQRFFYPLNPVRLKVKFNC